METFCAAPLYRTVENGLEISTRSCSRVLYDIGKCDASYLYLNERFLYTFACPIGSSETEERKEETFLVTTTTPPISFNRSTNFSFLRGSRNSSNNSNILQFSESNTTSNSSNTTKNSSLVFVYSVKKTEKEENSGTGNPIQPAFATTLIVVFTTMSVLSLAVLLYFKMKNNKAEKKKLKRPSSVMPEIVRQGPSSIQKEVRAVLNKIIKTICRWNGQEPYRQRAPKSAPETAPPVPPRPPQGFVNKRSETLQFIRQTNPHLGRPHSTIQKVLNKPVFNLQEEGKRRANLLKREAELERMRQERRKKSKRFQRIVRLRELHKKNGKEGSAKKEEQLEKQPAVKKNA